MNKNHSNKFVTYFIGTGHHVEAKEEIKGEVDSKYYKYQTKLNSENCLVIYLAVDENLLFMVNEAGLYDIVQLNDLV
jgi:hypothetical protein